ncbi:3-deoxy-D-manno-octulosonic acid kinase [Oceanospirillum sp.]|uniref:3-deoxy-D-manno-octulosonic acid kinase n=1 Tax=Oceanospirillum sp. TaxID=2021254 RepID=UPI003A90136D
MTIEIYSSKKQHILYDAEHLSQIDATFFQPEYWQKQQRLTEPSGGRGQAFFIQHPDGKDYLLRHYRRGGLMAKISQDKYWFSGLEESRPWREFHITYQLHQAGLPVPKPIAARVIQHGLLYQGDLLTLRIPDAHPFAGYLSDNHQVLLWQEVGKTIACFHRWGLNHVDLNANNILVNPEGKVWLIDFDRCKKMPKQGGWQEQNLARLYRSVCKLTKAQSIPEELWQALQKGYKS